jgi:UDP-N-acetylglucosamine/UDP-N-acetylgalactosamine diphosphorylase
MSAENILNFSKELLEEQRKALFETKPKEHFEPWLDVSSPTENEMGFTLLKKGKAACVILAGGQGTRLEWSGPKALYPIVPQKNLTLLQILLEKVRRVSFEFGFPLEVAVMTSRISHDRFEHHAELHNFYGLERSQLTFFPQNVLPLLDEKGNWFYEKPGQLALGPDGNGGVFHNLVQTGILKRWKQQGIEAIIVLQVDNPLAEPFDSYILHELISKKCDVVAKAIERIDPEEKIGVFAKNHGKLCVVEYSEIDAENKLARTSDGKFAWPYANIGGFAFS